MCSSVELVVLTLTYRSLVGPVLDYIDGIEKAKEDVVTVILPETFSDAWWDVLLHSNAGPTLMWS